MLINNLLWFYERAPVKILVLFYRVELAFDHHSNGLFCGLVLYLVDGLTHSGDIAQADNFGGVFRRGLGHGCCDNK